MDSYRQYSLELIRPALARLRHGDPAAVEFLYRHYPYLQADVQLLVFRTFAKHLRETQDMALAARFAARGPKGFGAGYPHLTLKIQAWSNRVWVRAAKELMRPAVGDIPAASPRAVALRNLVLDLPLQAIVGAKARRATSRAMASPFVVTTRRRLRSARRAALEVSKLAGARAREHLAGIVQAIKSRQRPRP